MGPAGRLMENLVVPAVVSAAVVPPASCGDGSTGMAVAGLGAVQSAGVVVLIVGAVRRTAVVVAGVRAVGVAAAHPGDEGHRHCRGGLRMVVCVVVPGLGAVEGAGVVMLIVRTAGGAVMVVAGVRAVGVTAPHPGMSSALTTSAALMNTMRSRQKTRRQSSANGKKGLALGCLPH